MKYWEDNHRTLYNSSCLLMSELSDESIQCVVTSPPYWVLRKYAGEQELTWGGDENCQHAWGENIPSPTLGNICPLCGAWKGAYGLEPNPEMYVQHTIEILREIRRVLRKDGVVFWNIGDSYYSQPAGNKEPSGFQQKSKAGISGSLAQYGKIKFLPQHSILKPKDLCLIPFRVAIAAQEDGWWVRSDIIWSKPNPMPESVTDRPTNSHEYILMLTKSAKYYWDAEAVREENRDSYNGHRGAIIKGAKTQSSMGDSTTTKEKMLEYATQGRNLRSVWEFPTHSYKDAHFAVFPEKLPELCIKAATPEVGCCSGCGKPWERVVAKESVDRTRLVGIGQDSKDGTSGRAGETKQETLGWQPQCKCNANKVPSIVLDPFAGAGTTLKVAAGLNRRAIGYEISEEYCKLIVKRNRQGVIV